MYLIIDTTTRHGAVGLWRDGYLVRSASWHARHNHTAELMPAIDAALAHEEAEVSDLQGVAVATGPGGFSALRAGLSVAKGLALGLPLPVVGISSLEASAYPHRDLGYPVCALLESGRGLVAWARFQQTSQGWRRRTPDRITDEDTLLSARGRHTLFCGEGVAAYSHRLMEALGARAHLVQEPAPLGRLLGLAALGAARLEAGEHDRAASLQPHYLRAPGITTPKPPRPVKYGGRARPASASRVPNA